MKRHRIAYSLLLALSVASTAQANIDNARAKGIKWLVQTQKGDGSFAGLQGLEVQSTSAAVEAMLAAGLTRSPHYSRALAWLANAPGGSLDARAWQASALAAAGRDATGIAGGIRDERNMVSILRGLPYNSVAVWGPFPGYAASSADTALAYGSLRSAGIVYTNDQTEFTKTVQCLLMPAQLTASPWAGSWPHALPQTGQPAAVANGSLFATALLLHELKKSRQASRFLTSTYYCENQLTAVDTALTSAKTWLLAQANGDGGFAERSPQTGSLEASNPLATAMAVRALALFAAEGDTEATTAIANARTWLAGQQNADGSWRGDPFVTARVVAALPAAAGAQLTDSDQDGLTDVVEQQLGTQVLVADAQGQLDPNANAVPGLTATSFSVTASLNEAFSYTVSAAGGNGPFSFARVNGSLPPGLVMASNGQISGVPTAPGSYAFDYEVTDTANARTLVIGRVDVISPSPSDGDVPLPAWALALLGAGLFGALRRHALRTAA